MGDQSAAGRMLQGEGGARRVPGVKPDQVDAVTREPQRAYGGQQQAGPASINSRIQPQR